MAEIEKKPVKIVETVLRDAHQSLLATRMSTDQMLPIVDKMDQVGYYAVECWGGATFDSCLRFLKEDPWERLRKLRAGFKNTKLQMLFRGQNILGYNHYADDVVEYFVQKSIANGIDIIRIFDCLNDIRNLRTAVKATNKEIKTMHTKCMGPDDMITSLSGGNQQKVIFGKWLERTPQVFMMDEPTRGIDVGAKYEIYELIIQMAKQGKTVIVVSSEMPEILGITNRIGVMSNGRLSGIVNTRETNQEELLRLSAKYL